MKALIEIAIFVLIALLIYGVFATVGSGPALP